MTVGEILKRLNADPGCWIDMGLQAANKKRRHLIAPKSELRELLDAGLLVVRSATYDVWTPTFDKESSSRNDSAASYRKRTRRVEAMITASGVSSFKSGRVPK